LKIDAYSRRELDAVRGAGLWTVRVLAGAATPGELALIAPVLAGAADLSHHPYRLGSAQAAQSLAEALAPDPGPGAGPGVPFDATAGVLTALAGLPPAHLLQLLSQQTDAPGPVN